MQNYLLVWQVRTYLKSWYFCNGTKAAALDIETTEVRNDVPHTPTCIFYSSSFIKSLIVAPNYVLP
jgi:hypothetical protein